MSDVSRAEICIVAIAEAFRGDGEVLISPIGNLPQIGCKLAISTFEPDLLMTDGVAFIQANVTPVGGAEGSEKIVEAYMPYREIFNMLWNGRRHVMMGASQIDKYGNQNIACIGEFAAPKAQLLGMRGAPGNTINHPTSYWVPNHSTKTFVEKVDVCSGLGYDRVRALGKESSRFHCIKRVVSNLGVFDFNTPDNSMRLLSVHPGVTLDDVVENSSFELVIDSDIPESRAPTDEELHLIRDVIDPNGIREKEIRA